MSIDLSAEAFNTVAYSYTYRCRVESWLDGVLLADDIPVVSGREEADSSLTVPERVTLTVPRRSDGTDWAPGDDDDHPLAANGQRLRVLLGIGLGSGQVEWLQRGEFVIYESEPAGETVRVDARGLLHLIDEARLVSPYQPTGTLQSTVRGLVEPALTVDFSTSLDDRAVPAAVNFDEDRLAALYEVLDAWPARARVTATGVLRVEPVDEGPGLAYLYDEGPVRTITDRASRSTRENAFTAVVARGTATDGGQVQGVEVVRAGPHAYGGPLNPLPVPFYFSSPLLTTVAQCRAAARTILDRKQRQSLRPQRIVAAPSPEIQLHDLIRVNDDGTWRWSVEALSLPYTAGDGAMGLTVRDVLL